MKTVLIWLLLCLIWGTTWIFIKIGLDDLPPPGMDSTFLEPAPLRAIPNMALCGGLTFAVWDYFQFFIDARYSHANYTGPYSNLIPLDEVVLGAGLGWQVPVKRLLKK